MNLETLLAEEADVPVLSDAAYESIRTEIRHAARIDVVRAAKRAKVRRIGITVAGIAAASLAVTTAFTQSFMPTGDHDAGTVQPVDLRYKTVADVLDAAAAAPSPADPALAPYWKVVATSPCVSTRFLKFAGGTTCTNTNWFGNDRPSIYLPSYPGIPGDSRAYGGGPPSAHDVNGKAQSWRQINARRWTASQIASLVEADKPPTEPSAVFDFAAATDLLTNAPASANIRKQLWAYLKTIPGLRIEGRVHDALGRTGWRIAMLYGPGDTPSVIIDPASGLVLEQENLAEPDSRTTITFAGPTDDAPRV